MSDSEAGLRLASRDTKGFPSPFDDASIGNPYSKHEIDMQALSYAIRSKPDWVRKSKDKKILKKWREEALEQSKTATKWGAPLSEKLVDFVLGSWCCTPRGRRRGSRCADSKRRATWS
jgi:hypothetical protein